MKARRCCCCHELALCFLCSHLSSRFSPVLAVNRPSDPVSPTFPRTSPMSVPSPPASKVQLQAQLEARRRWAAVAIVALATVTSAGGVWRVQQTEPGHGPTLRLAKHINNSLLSIRPKAPDLQLASSSSPTTTCRTMLCNLRTDRPQQSRDRRSPQHGTDQPSCDDAL